MLSLPATPAPSAKAGVPNTPTPAGADERHTIFIQDSEPEDNPDGDADGDVDDGASTHSAEEDVEIISGPVNVANFAGPSGGGALPAYRSCMEYYHIPPVPLVINPAIQSKKWFIVTRGRFVGVFNTCASSDAATKKISTNCHWRHKGFQQDAVDQFNVALELGQFSCPPTMSESQREAIWIVLSSDEEETQPPPPAADSDDDWYTAGEDFPETSFEGDDEFCAFIASLDDAQIPGTAAFKETAARGTPTLRRPGAAHGPDTTRSQASQILRSHVDATVVATQKRRKVKTKHLTDTPPVIVVFIGLQPGVYSHWTLAAPQVLGVSGSVYFGYKTWPIAEKAFDYAVQRGWAFHIRGGRRLPYTLIKPSPAPGHPFQTPLTHGITRKNWYCVYRGLSPGIYRSYLECALNTLGVPHGSFEAFRSRTVAHEKFRLAQERGEVEVVAAS
ncbi:hypothetical protein BDZ89DRAFT_1043217 [Hymenopellis radicata]|nr:hypothetical protein BDZ89DRAFT_1043217 [Hymenopellis radicata]